MKLKSIVNEIRDRHLKDLADALQAIAESEKYLKQAYEGGYLFEQIQNARDASKEVRINRIVTIQLKLKDRTLSIEFGSNSCNVYVRRVLDVQPHSLFPKDFF